MDHSDLKRKESESIDEYLLRLGDNKELYNLDWLTIRQYMNEAVDEDFGESKWRKEYHILKRGYNLAVERKVTDNEILNEIEEKTIAFQKEKFKFQDQKREFTNLIRQQARFEHLKEEIHKSIIDISKQKPLTFIQPPTTLSNVRANVLWSDWHVGADFSNSLNRYNIDVFKQRLQILVSEIISEGKKNNVDTLTIGALGDFISGAIHVSTRVQSSEDVIKQIQIVSEYMAESIAEISKHFRFVRFINIIGNHARLISDKTQSIFTENLENLIPWYLETRLKDFKNVDIYKDTDGYFIDETFEQSHVYVHGDLDHVSSVAKSLPQILGIVPRYVFCGHIHHDTVKEYGRTKVISNGSLMGIDDYALSKRFYAEPMQKMHIFDDNDRIKYTVDIYLN
ncbi:hypothetical protein [Paenibacillus naphthalenovorans]|uniref:Metallo-dependent phosphatase-like protein n=1 Tax=Paenibacillus naphthalenovorans TaxID=162209 RepID=A0A0U2VNH8_9BACL|nr:hypothetical protein [Paenibacillus naphthalenovorans]ALS22294.1 metallo-dependent phosphatase-like protein [Paenibacillus naphthalenovorans]